MCPNRSKKEGKNGEQGWTPKQYRHTLLKNTQFRFFPINLKKFFETGILLNIRERHFAGTVHKGVAKNW